MDRMFARGHLVEMGPLTVAAISKGFRERHPDWVEPTARRLAAAWNAVRNIPTEALEAGVVKELVVALYNLEMAAFSRENTMGDPCSLIHSQQQLKRRIRESAAVRDKLEHGGCGIVFGRPEAEGGE